ncbi:MAG: methylmalonyl Co-A mutase-associated GTPase MeaB [Acidobacteriota bacterium]
MADLAEDVLRGDLRALGRAATLIENQEQSAAPLLTEIRPHAGHALILGITGAPGAGKSTLCDRMISLLRTEGKTVGVIAVDPSSPVTGGAILGDRIRMQQHHADSGVFIRSTATRGVPGGIARATADLATLLDAAGRDVVIIETVGVGQSEVEIARLAQVTILVMVPGAGDDIQAMKAGLLEVADIFVINKADLPGTDKIEQELHSVAGDRPVLRTVASEGHGIAEVLRAAQDCKHAAHLPAAAGASIDHLGIAVRSLDEALKFYETQLGLGVAARETVAHEKVNVAMLPLGDPRIELLESSEPDSVIAKFIEQRGEGLHHVALKVPDLSTVVDRLRSSGARILNEPRVGAGGHLYVFVHPASTGGVLLELIQA